MKQEKSRGIFQGDIAKVLNEMNKCDLMEHETDKLASFRKGIKYVGRHFFFAILQ